MGSAIVHKQKLFALHINIKTQNANKFALKICIKSYFVIYPVKLLRRVLYDNKKNFPQFSIKKRGYSLESPCRGDSNEYPQHNNKNYYIAINIK